MLDPLPVFSEVKRVLRRGKRYVLKAANQFVIGLFETDRNGNGYPVNLPYVNGTETHEPVREFTDEEGALVRTIGLGTFRHTLSWVLNPMAGLSFALKHILEEPGEDLFASPGTCAQFTNVAVLWFTVWFSR